MDTLFALSKFFWYNKIITIKRIFYVQYEEIKATASTHSNSGYCRICSWKEKRIHKGCKKEI